MASDFHIGIEFFLMLFSISLLSGLMFYFVGGLLRIKHRQFWTAIGVFLGFLALPFIFFAKRKS